MFDVPVNAWFQALSHPVLTQFMLAITHWHNTLGLWLMACAVAYALYRSRRRWWLLALVLSVPGGMLLNVVVKHAVQRARPHIDNPLLIVDSYSFPSGHTMGATVLYGFLAVFLIAHVCDRRWHVAITAAAVGMVALVGASRIYLQVHYPSDVVGAVVQGLLWLALCLWGVRALWRRSTAGHEQAR